MAVGVFTPAVPDAGSIILGEGKVYVDYDEVSQAEIGATRGGSKLDVERTIKEIDYDGSYGPTKGLRRYELLIGKLTINFLKITTENLTYGVPVTRTTGNTNRHGTYNELTFDLEITTTDVLTNVTFIGQTHTGIAIRIKVLNALNIDNISWDFKAKDEIVSEMVYTGFYAEATPTTSPIEIEIDEAA